MTERRVNTHKLRDSRAITGTVLVEGGALTLIVRHRIGQKRYEISMRRVATQTIRDTEFSVVFRPVEQTIILDIEESKRFSWKHLEELLELHKPKLNSEVWIEWSEEFVADHPDL